MSLNQPGFYGGETTIINPVFSGIVQTIKPEDLGYSYGTLFPVHRFNSRGNGIFVFQRYNMVDAFRELGDEVLIRRPATPAFSLSRPRSFEFRRVSRRHIDAAVNDEEAQMIRDQTNGADDPNVTELQYVRGLMMLNKEIRAAKFAANVSNVGTNLAPGTAWSSPTATPLEDLNALRMSIRQKSGLWPTKAAMPYEVALRLASNTQLREARAHTERTSFSYSAVALLIKELLALDELHLFTSMTNSVAPQAFRNPSMNLQSTWGPHVYMWAQQGDGVTGLNWAVEAIDTYFGKEWESPAYPIPLPDSEVTKYRIREDSDFVLLNKEVAGALRNVV